mmetsp:Transcript_31276/g.65903  ORF Transcript_31276/g.65903 Transcript_31276/m.65903 type:complete len:206 (-) Transcript_31276:407-1024(-)
MPQHTVIANWIRADGLCQPACSFALQNVLLLSKVFEFDSIPSKNRLGPLNIAQQPPSQKFHLQILGEGAFGESASREQDLHRNCSCHRDVERLREATHGQIERTVSVLEEGPADAAPLVAKDQRHTLAAREGELVKRLRLELMRLDGCESVPLVLVDRLALGAVRREHAQAELLEALEARPARLVLGHGEPSRGAHRDVLQRSTS